MSCVPSVEWDSFVNILSAAMNISVNRLKRWEDNKLDFFGNSISCLAECWIIFGRKME